MVRWLGRALGLLLVLWLGFLAASCSMPRQVVTPTPDSTSAIYVVRHGWHAGVAVRRADLPAEAWPVLDHFPTAAYLEVGWGEADYFPARDPGLGTLLKAGLWPTASVLHVVPVPRTVPEHFPHNTIIRIPVGPEELEALTRFIRHSFATDTTDRPIAVAPGYYSGSRFYRSSLKYHVFNNCNHWAAFALEAAGCDTAPRWTLTVGRLLDQAARCGTVVQGRP